MSPTDLLAARIAERDRDIVAHVLAATYQDPFWDDRFGASGRRAVAEDGEAHVTHLAEALRQGSPEPLCRHATWLRNAAVARGMCTRHLEAQLACIGEALRALGIDGCEPALGMLRAARGALRYPDGSAGQVHARTLELVERAHGELAIRAPQWSMWLTPQQRQRVRDDLLDLLSYVADALHARRPELFVSHARWVDGFYGRQGRPAGYLDTLVVALDREAEEMEAAARAEVARLLARARIVNGSSQRLA